MARPPKPHKLKSLKLNLIYCPIVELSQIGGQTFVLELGIKLIQELAISANAGNKKAIAMLSSLGVEASFDGDHPIVVTKLDFSINKNRETLCSMPNPSALRECS